MFLFYVLTNLPRSWKAPLAAGQGGLRLKQRRRLGVRGPEARIAAGRGAQRRRFGEPGLSSAASNSMGRFHVASHAVPPKDQAPGADAAVTAAQPPTPQRSSQAKPATMAAPAPAAKYRISFSTNMVGD